ncbi:MAG TPA: thioesterase family protein [Methylomirabilota bacterium]|nr:thioesterase family protein [Methylomirabilota bacterium]
MPYEHKLIRRVEFPETDMAGIVHFTNFFRYMEYAEHDFYRSLGHSVIMPHLNPPLGFPRVHASCDYKKPIRFEDMLEIHLLVKEKRARVLSYIFKFRKEGETEEIARGALTVVCVSHVPGKMEAVPIPAGLADQIQVAPAELLG